MIFLNVNWDAVSSVSNIALSVLTLMAVVVTYRTLVVSTRIKAKIGYQLKVQPTLNSHAIRLVNVRDVPVTVIYKGFYILDENKKELVIDGKRVNHKLSNSEVLYHSVNFKALNSILRRKGYKNKDSINVYGFFIATNSQKKFKHKIKHKITNDEVDIQLK